MFKRSSINEVSGEHTLQKKWLCLSEILRELKQHVFHVRQRSCKNEKLSQKSTCIFESGFFFLENYRKHCEDFISTENLKNSCTGGTKPEENFVLHCIEIYSGLSATKALDVCAKQQFRTDATSIETKKAMFAGLKKVTFQVIAHFFKEGQGAISTDSVFYSLRTFEDNISRLLGPEGRRSLSLFHESNEEIDRVQSCRKRKQGANCEASVFCLSRPPQWIFSNCSPERHSKKSRASKYNFILLDCVEIADCVELLLGTRMHMENEAAETLFLRKRGARKGEGLLLKLQECANHGTLVVLLGHIVQSSTSSRSQCAVESVLSQREIRKPSGEWSYAAQRIIWLFQEQALSLFDTTWLIEEMHPYVAVIKH
ncbi:hypothetical protein XU18_5003 [Perkinsela sp. CCAP 1560/4]|nr:hypothetical protein XU18_5003 [Perkinsela sp. CCAP 1560/4]|eukprot:KNH03663.1 hypothetical protein XU18_5003 [Perkinsela sp. CCAP 1560/4]